MDFAEVEFELRVEQSDFRPLEDLRHEVPALLQQLHRDVQRRHQKLRLDVLVHIVEAGDVWSSIADHQIAQLPSEGLEYLG